MTTVFGQSTSRTTAPYRYDVVGSFLRPAALKAAREQFATGTIGREALAEACRSSVPEPAVRLCFHGGGQHPDGRGAMEQAEAN